MKVKILSAKNYEEKDKNYGDCFIIDNGDEVIVYDCGSVEHAKRVINYMDERNIDKVKVILSHNDSDHFDGIPYLIEEEKVEKIYTVLLLKYKDELLDTIADGRKTRESISKQIEEKYSNIKELGGKNLLEEIEVGLKIAKGIEVVGPDHDYMIKAFAKALDTTEGDTIDCETVVNATSVQVSIKMRDCKMLLCGDCSFTAIEDKVKDYSIIQLPHHGKLDQAQKIFDAKKDNNTKYIVSDNTGNTVGGSDKLPTRGYDIDNTQNGDIVLNNYTSIRNYSGCYSMRYDNALSSK